MLDKKALHDFYNSDTESIKLILQQVGDNMVTVISDIENAKDLIELNHFLHYHGPSFTYAGLVSVTHTMKQLEDKTKLTANIADVQTDLHQLIQTLTQSKLEIDSYITEIN